MLFNVHHRYREKMKIPGNVMDQLVNGAQSDIRQVLNMLSTWKLSRNSIDFDEGQDLYVYHAVYNGREVILTVSFPVRNRMRSSLS